MPATAALSDNGNKVAGDDVSEAVGEVGKVPSCGEAGERENISDLAIFYVIF